MTSTERSPFKFLILGGGAIVVESHLPALRALQWLDQAVVVEPLARNADAIRERYPQVKIVTKSYQEALADVSIVSTVDAVLVALPNTLHADAVMQALAAGFPVLCEKPLALTAKQCMEIEDATLKHSKLVAVGMVRRFVPGLTALREALRAGLIGSITNVSLEYGGDVRHWPWDTETVLRRDQGGCLVNFGIHFLDYLEWIFGNLEPVSYTDDCAGGIEVNCDVRMLAANNVPVRVRVSWTHALKNELSVQGSTGTLSMNLNEFDCARWRAKDNSVSGVLKAKRPFQSGDWLPTFDSCFVEQFWQFSEAVRGNNDGSRLVLPRDASRSHEHIEWAYSRRRGGSIATFGRPTIAPASVAVTGGTGFVGSHLVERLAELGMSPITVPVRHFRTGAQIARFPVTMKRTNLLDEESCREAFRGAKYVFHLAYGAGGDNAGEFTLQSTRAVLRAALAERVESVVVFGTCTIWAGYDGVEVNEATAPKPGLGEYGHSKSKMQAECLAFAREHSQMRVSVVAPGAVYGPRGGLFCATPCTAARQGVFAWFEDGRGICNYVHVSNLIDLAILAATRSEAAGQCFIGVDGATDWKRFLTPLVEPWITTIPYLSKSEIDLLKHQPQWTANFRDLIRSAMASPEFIATLSHHPVAGRIKAHFTKLFPTHHRELQKLRTAPDRIIKPAKPATGVATWMADIYGPGSVRFSSRKAREVLGWQSRISLEQGMVDCVNWLREVELWEPASTCN